MKQVTIAATSYLNTIPFVYGIERSGQMNNYTLELDVPSVCGDKVIQGKADIGLIPVAMLPLVTDRYEMLNNYCLGANGKVKTVLLLSNVPLNEIKDIHLDFESRTSVRLVTILAEHYWKLKDVKWHAIGSDNLSDYTRFQSVVAIGDKTFELADKFKYQFDLAEEWYSFTSLPFVFACWVVKKNLPQETIEHLEKALKFGVDNKLEAVRDYQIKRLSDNQVHKIKIKEIDLEEYVEKYMNYDFDEAKHKALQLFLNYLDMTYF